MAADVRQQLDALRAVHERLRVVARREHVIVAGFGHHQLVADVARRAREQMPALGSSTRGSQYHEAGSCDVACRNRAAVARSDIDHPFMRESTNPTQQPGCFGYVVAKHPDRFAKSAARKDRVRTLKIGVAKRPRRQNVLVYWAPRPRVKDRLRLESLAVRSHVRDSRIPAQFRSRARRARSARRADGKRRAPLQESLAAYKRGAELLAYCQAALKDAQQQVQVLEKGVLQPFAADERRRCAPIPRRSPTGRASASSASKACSSACCPPATRRRAARSGDALRDARRRQARAAAARLRGVGSWPAPIRPSADARAAAVELIHAYSLVHDDLPCMDDDSLRRGKPTCHVAFDVATALLAGDALQSLAFAVARAASARATAAPPARCSRDAAGVAGMAGGQQLDLDATGAALDARFACPTALDEDRRADPRGGAARRALRPARSTADEARALDRLRARGGPRVPGRRRRARRRRLERDRSARPPARTPRSTRRRS